MIDLSDNTNLWGMSPAAERALRELPAARVARYPSWNGARLAEAAAAYVGVAAAAVGCGSDELLDAVMRATTQPGDTIAYSAPTFTMVPVYARANRLTARAIPLGDGFDLDAQRLVETGARIIYVCGPNNPTGTPISRAALEYVVERAPGIVLLDEAYAEFATRTNLDLVSRSDRLIVTRTLSKAFGLAGLRAGYAVASAMRIGELEKHRGPYMVNVVAEEVGIAALSESGVQWMREHAARARQARERLRDGLRAMGLEPLPSDANFVFVPLKNARRVAEAMKARGVVARLFEDLPLEIPVLAAAGGSGLRIGVGPDEAMTRCLEVLSASREDAGT